MGVIETIYRETIRGIVRITVACLGGMVVEGAEHVPSSGGVLIAPNHVSHLDPPVVGVCLRRAAWFMATDELFGIPVLGPMARWLRAYPIRQDSPDRAALRKTEGLLNAGEVVVAFPEGHESLDGRLQPLQRGVVWIALRAGVPIVPVGIRGTDLALPPREWRLRHAGRPIRVTFGAPIGPEELSGGMSGGAGADHGCDLLRKRLLMLTGEDARAPENHLAHTSDCRGVGPIFPDSRM